MDYYSRELIIEAGLFDAIKSAFKSGFDFWKGIAKQVGKNMFQEFAKEITGENQKSFKNMRELFDIKDKAFEDLNPKEPKERAVILFTLEKTVPKLMKSMSDRLALGLNVKEMPEDEKSQGMKDFQKADGVVGAVSAIGSYFGKAGIDLSSVSKAQAAVKNPEDPATNAKIMGEFVSEIAGTGISDQIKKAIQEFPNEAKRVGLTGDELKSSIDSLSDAVKSWAGHLAELTKVKESVAYNHGLLRMYVREKLLSEEIGRNYHTIDPSPNTWEDYSNSNYYYSSDIGSKNFVSKVDCDDERYTTKELSFDSEDDAHWWARNNSDICMRKTINKLDEQRIRRIIQKVLKT